MAQLLLATCVVLFWAICDECEGIFSFSDSHHCLWMIYMHGHSDSTEIWNCNQTNLCVWSIIISCTYFYSWNSINWALFTIRCSEKESEIAPSTFYGDHSNDYAPVISWYPAFPPSINFPMQMEIRMIMQVKMLRFVYSTWIWELHKNMHINSEYY